MTFAQAEGMFYRQNGYFPPRTLDNMPTELVDWFRKIRDVPVQRLRRSASRQIASG